MIVDGKYFSPLLDSIAPIRGRYNNSSNLCISRVSSELVGVCFGDVRSVPGAFSRAIVFKRLMNKLKKRSNIMFGRAHLGQDINRVRPTTIIAINHHGAMPAGPYAEHLLYRYSAWRFK